MILKSVRDIKPIMKTRKKGINSFMKITYQGNTNIYLFYPYNGLAILILL